MQTIEQQRAKYALDEVEKAIASDINQAEYKSYAASLPAMIHMNGLGQASAFFYSKKGTHLALYDLLSNWMTQQGQPYQDHRDLLKGITQSDMETYRLAQVEAQALMNWVKKFAKAFMGDT